MVLKCVVVLNSAKNKIIVVLLIALAAEYVVLSGKPAGNQAPVTTNGAPVATSTEKSDVQSGDLKTFTFDTFHGSRDISDPFQFQYPSNWYRDGQFLSPQKVHWYDVYSAKAPIYFDLVSADVFDQTALKYQITTSKRRSPDTTGEIDGKEFKRYDLTDYGSYGGESAGHVKIFVGPTMRIDGSDYTLVFHWEEKPLSEYMGGNDISVFDNMMLSLKFVH